MNSFVKGLLITGLVPVAVSIVSSVGFRANLDGLPFFYDDDATSFAVAWLIGPVTFVVGMIAGFMSPTFRTKGGRAGVLAGIGLAVVALGASCFAMQT